MTKVQPNKEFEIAFAKIVIDQETGEQEDMKFNFILTFKKPITDLQGGPEGMQKFFMEELGGVDNIKIAGRHSIEIVVARTFDPEEVVAAIEASLPALQSDIVRPSLVTE
jgi:hypothetical protein